MYLKNFETVLFRLLCISFLTYNIPGWNKSGNLDMKVYKQKNEKSNVVYGVFEFINEQGKTISKITPDKIEFMISNLKSVLADNKTSVESGLIIQKQINSLENQKEMLSDVVKLDAMMNLIVQSKIKNKSGWDWSATFQSIRNQSRYASGLIE